MKKDANHTILDSIEIFLQSSNFASSFQTNDSDSNERPYDYSEPLDGFDGNETSDQSNMSIQQQDSDFLSSPSALCKETTKILNKDGKHIGNVTRTKPYGTQSKASASSANADSNSDDNNQTPTHAQPQAQTQVQPQEPPKPLPQLQPQAPPPAQVQPLAQIQPQSHTYNKPSYDQQQMPYMPYSIPPSAPSNDYSNMRHNSNYGSHLPNDRKNIPSTQVSSHASDGKNIPYQYNSSTVDSSCSGNSESEYLYSKIKRAPLDNKPQQQQYQQNQHHQHQQHQQHQQQQQHVQQQQQHQQHQQHQQQHAQHQQPHQQHAQQQQQQHQQPHHQAHHQHHQPHQNPYKPPSMEQYHNKDVNNMAHHYNSKSSLQRLEETASNVKTKYPTTSNLSHNSSTQNSAHNHHHQQQHPPHHQQQPHAHHNQMHHQNAHQPQSMVPKKMNGDSSYHSTKSHEHMPHSKSKTEDKRHMKKQHYTPDNNHGHASSHGHHYAHSAARQPAETGILFLLFF